MSMTKAEVMMDLQSTPLGLGRGEGNLSTPFNASATQARIYVINHSATRERKYVAQGVSERRGIAEALLADKQLQKIHNVETMRQSIKEGVDMNGYAFKVSPVLYRVQHDSRDYYIEPAQEGEEPKPFLIPEGAWDKFMGNYQRMHSKDASIVANEQARVALLWMRQHSPIWKVTDDGVTTTMENPFGFLEIVRVVEKEAPQQVDRAFVTAMEIME